MRRVAMFLPDLSGGGAERLTLLLARTLKERSAAVELVIGRNAGAYADAIPKGVPVRELDAEFERLVPAVAQYLRRARPDVLLSSYDSVNDYVLAGALLSGVEVDTVPIVHTHLSAAVRHGNALERRLAPATRVLYASASAVVGVSLGVVEDLRTVYRLPKERLVTIYNPVDANLVESSALQPVDDPWWPKTGPVVIAVGRLGREKGLPDLIAAFSQSETGRRGHLILLGDGPERANLCRIVSDLKLSERVILPGFVANPHRYVARADAFVLASQYEGLSYALIEACLVGRSVVATDCEVGPREVLEGGRWGRMVPVGHISLLARAIDAAVDHPMADLTARRLAMRRRFSLSRAVDQYAQVLGLVSSEAQAVV